MPWASVVISEGLADADWWQDTNLGQTRLHLGFAKKSLQSLPPAIHLVRKDVGGQEYELATLADLKKLVLPSKLTLMSLGDDHIMLRGATNAAAIDAVSLQTGSKTFFDPVSSGTDFGLADLTLAPAPARTTESSPAKPKGKPAGAAQGKGSTGPPAKQLPAKGVRFTVVHYSDDADNGFQASGKSGDSQSTSTAAQIQKKSSNKGKGPSATSSAETTPKDTSLPPGTYAVLPLFYADEFSDDPSKRVTSLVPRRERRPEEPLDVHETKAGGIKVRQGSTEPNRRNSQER